MNLIIIPFHDWRKSEKEGFRTRDVQFIKALAAQKQVGKILVVNRPSTWLELLYKKQKKKLRGKIVLKKGNCILTQVEDNIFVTDFHSADAFNQYRKKYRWFMNHYADPEYVAFIGQCREKLNLTFPRLIVQNVFAYKLALKLDTEKKMYDAWDNFLNFSVYKPLKNELETAYGQLAKKIKIWITNSRENIDFFKHHFPIKEIVQIKNGVSTTFLDKDFSMPKDMAGLKKPIIGFGGKISHLLDTELINYLTKDNPQTSFVFVGQILDKTVFKKLAKRENTFFLGDKHYDIYPAYVQNFDICIIPYKTTGQYGADSIKAYEYLLTGKKVVGTPGNGLPDLKNHLYLPPTKEEFSRELKDQQNEKPPMDIEEHSWGKRAKKLIEILNR